MKKNTLVRVYFLILDIKHVFIRRKHKKKMMHYYLATKNPMQYKTSY